MRITDRQGRLYEVTATAMTANLIVYHVAREALPVARAVLNTARCCIQDVVVYDAADRRQGIATALYDAIEAERGVTLVPNRMRLADGKSFWRARTGTTRSALGRMAPRYAKP